MRINSWSETADYYLREMNNPDKIGVVTDTAQRGSGIGRVARNLAMIFSDKNKEVTLYTTKAGIDKETMKELQKKEVCVKQIEQPTGIRKIADVPRIASVFEEDRLDHINTHGFYLSLAAVLSKIPVSKTYHAHVTLISEITQHPLKWLKWVIEDGFSVWFAENRISISEYAKKQMKMFYLRNSKVIHNGIDKRKFQRKETHYREKLGISDDVYLVGSLSSHKKYKNQKEALEFFSEEYNEQGSLLLIGGDGPRTEYLKQTANELGISNRTKFIGYIPEEEIVEFYNALDLFIYPSKWEGFGLPPLEAICCETEVRILNPQTALKEVADIV